MTSVVVAQRPSIFRTFTGDSLRPHVWSGLPLGSAAPARVSLESDRSSTEENDTPFQPTAEQVEQSRLNELESAEMAAMEYSAQQHGRRLSRIMHNINSGHHEGARRTSLSNVLSRQTSNTQSRRPSAVSIVRVDLPRQMGASLARPLLSGADMFSQQQIQSAADARAREMRLLRPKSLFSSQDNLRLALEAAQLQATLAGASASALYVSTRHVGPLTEVCECHGFCYSVPVNVRISSYPVFDGEAAGERQKGSGKVKLKRVFSKEVIERKWSRICIESHAAIFLCPPVPRHRMLKLKQADLIGGANSGDLLLEGSLFDGSSQYIQYKSDAVTSHVSIVYRNPTSGLLYALTSRNWSKHFRNTESLSSSLLDLQTFQMIDGVQMHPLEEYISVQRKRGYYFVFRRLQRTRRRLHQTERLEIGEAIHDWYGQHQGTPCPGPVEARQRLKQRRKHVAGRELNARSKKIMALGNYSSSQACIEALQHAGIFSVNVPEAKKFLSTSSYFEMRQMDLVPSKCHRAFTYDSMALIIGDINYAGRRAYVGLSDSSNVRIIESGAV